MFSLTICFGPTGTLWTMLFKTEQNARQISDIIKEEMVTYKLQGKDGYGEFNDEFGQSFSLAFSAIHGMMLEDLEQSKLAHIERALHQARTQALGQTMVESDSTLKAARQRQGAAIIQPFPGPSNGGFRG